MDYDDKIFFKINSDLKAKIKEKVAKEKTKLYIFMNKLIKENI